MGFSVSIIFLILHIISMCGNDRFFQALFYRVGQNVALKYVNFMAIVGSGSHCIQYVKSVKEMYNLWEMHVKCNGFFVTIKYSWRNVLEF